MSALRALALLVAFALLPAAQAMTSSDKRSREFEVLLDGDPIGFHRYEMLARDGGHEVISEASFDVRILFINAFRYRHTNREYWDGQCLSSIESQTRQNGKQFEVTGSKIDDRFVLNSMSGADELDACVMTFAYWDPRFLNQSRLLNPQSGEYLQVEVEPLGDRLLTVRGEAVQASAFRITAPKVDLTVWYSQDEEWLGLESVAKGGRILRYELT